MNPEDLPPAQPESLVSRPTSLPPPDLTPAVEQLQQQAEDLRTLFNATFVALIVMALGVSLFIYKQMRMARDQLNQQRPDMQKAEAEFRKRDPEFKRFVTAMQQYAASHPDYAQIFSRYRPSLQQYFPSTTVLAGKPDPGATVPVPVQTNK
jgi:hypothetical protein